MERKRGVWREVRWVGKEGQREGGRELQGGGNGEETRKLEAGKMGIGRDRCVRGNRGKGVVWGWRGKRVWMVVKLVGKMEQMYGGMVLREGVNGNVLEAGKIGIGMELSVRGKGGIWRAEWRVWEFGQGRRREKKLRDRGRGLMKT